MHLLGVANIQLNQVHLKDLNKSLQRNGATTLDYSLFYAAYTLYLRNTQTKEKLILLAF